MKRRVGGCFTRNAARPIPPATPVGASAQRDLRVAREGWWTLDGGDEGHGLGSSFKSCDLFLISLSAICCGPAARVVCGRGRHCRPCRGRVVRPIRRRSGRYAFDGAHGYVLARVRGLVDEGAALGFVGQVSFFFEAAKNRANCRVLHGTRGGQRFAAVFRGRRAVSPEESMTSCSTSPMFFRRGCGVLVIVALQCVTVGRGQCQGGEICREGSLRRRSSLDPAKSQTLTASTPRKFRS